jgi:Linear amide C-N hydrolases, choloylglycine hydrolase family
LRIRTDSCRFLLLALLLLLPACGPPVSTQLVPHESLPELLPLTPAQALTQPPSEIPSAVSPGTGLSQDQIATLSSLKLVDDFPLYEMHFQGEYGQKLISKIDSSQPIPIDIERAQIRPSWGCSLFAALGNPGEMLFGRNFDWTDSPALLLYTDPPDGYASVSIVDIRYLFPEGQLDNLHTLPLEDRKSLLQAAWMPFDGMNKHGLAIGMAAVPPGGLMPDPAKPAIDSLEIMREILDHARDVDEALGLFQSYSVLMDGGPPLHYLIADRSGRAVLVEYTDQITFLTNQYPWHLATNHLRALVEPGAPSGCWRYDKIEEQLDSKGGQLTSQEAVDLLVEVSQSAGSATQWSVVYGMSTGEVQVGMGRDYGNVLSFQLDMAEESPALNQGGVP